MLDTINKLLITIDNLIWGIPLILLILSVGVFMTVRLKGLQVTRLGTAFKSIFSSSSGTGEVSGFASLCTALSATIGTGNIIGVATAIVAGGPGAMFWMWIAAIVGTVTKYSECLLAVKFRHTESDGHIVGGPFYYIEKGMGKKFTWLAKLFAIFGAGAGLMGIGTFTQVNGITNSISNFFDGPQSKTISLFGMEYTYTVVISSILLTLCTALVIIGGIKRISNVAQVIVPFMAGTYVLTVLIILFTHASQIPAAFATIIESAFGLRAVTGGALGSIMIAMQMGVARGIFSNEAGLGSAPIAAAAACCEYPAKQGLVSMTGTVIDTLIICTMTGLSIIITGAWDMGLNGVAITTKAFELGLPFPAEVSSFLLMLCLVFFAFTTILGWNYYSERCLEYLVKGNKKILTIFRWAYILCVFIGPFMTVSAVWTIADIFNGLMAIPNLLAIIALNGVVVSETKRYFEAMK